MNIYFSLINENIINNIKTILSVMCEKQTLY